MRQKQSFICNLVTMILLKKMALKVVYTFLLLRRLSKNLLLKLMVSLIYRQKATKVKFVLVQVLKMKIKEMIIPLALLVVLALAWEKDNFM
jgi:hypothetical protein